MTSMAATYLVMPSGIGFFGFARGAGEGSTPPPSSSAATSKSTAATSTRSWALRRWSATRRRRTSSVGSFVRSVPALCCGTSGYTPRTLESAAGLGVGILLGHGGPLPRAGTTVVGEDYGQRRTSKATA